MNIFEALFAKNSVFAHHVKIINVDTNKFVARSDVNRTDFVQEILARIAKVVKSISKTANVDGQKFGET